MVVIKSFSVVQCDFASVDKRINDALAQRNVDGDAVVSIVQLACDPTDLWIFYKTEIRSPRLFAADVDDGK